MSLMIPYRAPKLLERLVLHHFCHYHWMRSTVAYMRFRMVGEELLLHVRAVRTLDWQNSDLIIWFASIIDSPHNLLSM